MEKNFVEKILIKLNVSGADIAMPKWGKRPEILYKDLLSAILSEGSIRKASLKLGLAERSLENFIKRYLVEVFPKNPQVCSWDNILLQTIDYLKCGRCNSILPKTDIIRSGSNYTCKACKSARAKDYYTNNKESRLAYSAHYYASNSEHLKELAKEWRSNNLEKVSAYSSNRRAMLNRSKSSTSGYEYGDRNSIADFFVNRPAGMHVDHIIPLVHDRVCGLHVISNLQYLSPIDNLSKGNKFNE